jgi:hypothetical protein
MRATTDGLVQIARDFLEVHALTQTLFARHRAGDLRFEALAEWVGDDHSSLLFRLKERCHSSFRVAPVAGAAPMHREALFDLAVGSLFHEAMKFRENFYQREIYGPRVLALRSEVGEEEGALFDEFERIQEGVSARLEEGLIETEALLDRTVEQFRRLLTAHADDPLVARLLFIEAKEAEAVFGQGVTRILEEIIGDAATGFERAGRSLLRSGYYPEAIRALEAAKAAGRDADGIDRMLAYANGMQAYLERDYGACVEALTNWATAREESTTLTRLARDAAARILQLAEGPERERITRSATQLLEQLAD